MIINQNNKQSKKRLRSENSRICYNYQNGNCLRGDTCKFRHDNHNNSNKEEEEDINNNNNNNSSNNSNKISNIKNNSNKSDLNESKLSEIIRNELKIAEEIYDQLKSTKKTNKQNNNNNNNNNNSEDKLKGNKKRNIIVTTSVSTPNKNITINNNDNNNKNNQNDNDEINNNIENNNKKVVTQNNNDDDNTKNFMTDEKFNSLPISPLLIRAIEEVLGYSTLTIVQSLSLPHILSGNDCLAKAKTGTGKTLAFLIPSVEKILRSNHTQKKYNNNSDNDNPNELISTLILSPTRELANQIAQEAIKLIRFLPNHQVVTLTGGTNRNADIRHLAGPISVLVATPGRLIDHLDNTIGIAARCKNISTLILDEADVLLEMGFKPALDQILNTLGSNHNRQTLLFSATVPQQVQQIATRVLKSNYNFIDTIGEEASNHTHEHVEQTVIISTMEKLIANIVFILREQIKQDKLNHKIIIFFTTARITGYIASFFRKMNEFRNIFEIHSRKSQSFRTKSSEQFRTCRSGILFSSDVSARGMDYPDVTYVLQVGLTEKEQYIHRLGRTARAGKSGSGALLLYDFEEKYMLQKVLKDLPINKREINSNDIDQIQNELQDLSNIITTDTEIHTCAEQSYQAWLGFYNSHQRVLNWDKIQLVNMANRYAQSMGFDEPPMLEAKTIGKMGLKGIPGLRILRNR